MSLRMKFLNVMKACAYVQKQGENTFYRYKYATAADVFEKVNAALVQQGIISQAKPEILSSEPVTTNKGNLETRVTIAMTVTLTDTVSGESMTMTAFGSGQDTGDKAVMKAQTAALKYCYMMSLNISTGDDPEADAGVDVRAVSTGDTPNTASSGESALVSKDTGGGQKTLANTAQAVSSQSVPPPRKGNSKITLEQLKIIFVLSRRAGIADEYMKDRIHREFCVASSRELTKEQAAGLIDELKEAVQNSEAAG
ncbi:MAG: ERF family protein [Pelosinus sp.]|nr:ERF family protein [Pelosinus sp.]